MSVPYQITSRLAGGLATVNPTSHPLVALFSAPACLQPNKMHVLFLRPGDTAPQVLIGCLAGPSPRLQHRIGPV